MQYKSYIVEQNLKIIKEKLVLFHGENIGLKNEFKIRIKVNYKDKEILNFTQDEILKNEAIILKEIMNISLFEKEKIFFIQNANDKILDLIIKIKELIDNQKIYLFSDTLEKKSKLRNFFEKTELCALIACYQDNELSLKRIIENYLNGFKGLTPNNINLIIDNCNLDRAKLYNELKKIIGFFDNKLLDEENLLKLLNHASNNDFNALRDEALMGNKIKTNKLLANTVIEDDKIIYYINIINSRLNKIKEIDNSDKQSLENAINNLKPPVFWKDKPFFLAQAKKWNNEKIKKTLNQTYDLEIKIKSNSSINKKVLIKKLLIDICQMANA